MTERLTHTHTHTHTHITLIAESEEELMSLYMRVKEETEKLA